MSKSVSSFSCFQNKIKTSCCVVPFFFSSFLFFFLFGGGDGVNGKYIFRSPSIIESVVFFRYVEDMQFDGLCRWKRNVLNVFFFGFKGGLFPMCFASFGMKSVIYVSSENV